MKDDERTQVTEVNEEIKGSGPHEGWFASLKSRCLAYRFAKKLCVDSMIEIHANNCFMSQLRIWHMKIMLIL